MLHVLGHYVGEVTLGVNSEMKCTFVSAPDEGVYHYKEVIKSNTVASFNVFLSFKLAQRNHSMRLCLT